MASKYLDDSGLLYLWGKIKGAFVLRNATITAATKTKVTYDAKGLITGGSDASTADIPDSTDKRYVTEAEKTKLSSLSGTNTGNETAASMGALINGASAKTNPVDADMVGLMDSAASNVLKKLSWANIKATLKSYFDTLYSGTGHNHSGTYQPMDADLTAIAGLSGTSGILKKTAADTWSLDTASYLTSAVKGAASGICPLGADSLVPSQYLPSYVDDVVELVSVSAAAPATCSTGQKYFNTSTSMIHTATAANTWGGGIAPLSDKIYIDTGDNSSYRWGGTVMVQITSSDVVGITNAEIDAIAV